MVTYEKDFQKSVKVSGKLRTKEGKYAIRLASIKELDTSTSRVRAAEWDDEDPLASAMAILGDIENPELEIVKWFDFGRLAHARITFSNLLAGTNKQLNTLLASFEENAKAIAEYTGEDLEKVKDTLLEKKADVYGPVKAHFDSFKVEGRKQFDESQLTNPNWFKIGSSDDDEEGEENES